jgi:hypothetical protein
LLARVTGEMGAFHFARYDDSGSTRMTSRFMPALRRGLTATGN